MRNAIGKIDSLIEDICHDSYFLTNDEISSIEWRLREIQQLLKDLYRKSGKQMQ